MGKIHNDGAALAAHYATIFAAYRQGESELDRALEAVCREHVSAIPDTMGRCFLNFGTRRHECAERVYEQAASMVRRLCLQASEQFAPGDAPLTIEHEGYLARFLGDGRPSAGGLVDFDANEVWRALEAEFGGSRGVEQGYREAAEQLISSFWILPDTEIKYRGRFPVLRLGVYPERDFRDPKVRRIGSCYRRVNAVLEALGVFARWEGRDEDFVLSGWGWHDPVWSRRTSGVMPGLEYRTFYEHFDFLFTPELFERFQVFIGTYGADLLAQRAA